MSQKIPFLGRCRGETLVKQMTSAQFFQSYLNAPGSLGVSRIFSFLSSEATQRLCRAMRWFSSS